MEGTTSSARKRADSRRNSKVSVLRRLEKLQAEAERECSRGKIVIEITYCDGVAVSIKSHLEEHEAVPN